MKKVQLAILGLIIGIPLSYYFQSELVKAKAGGIGGYINKLSEISKEPALLNNIAISMIFFGLIGGIIGYILDENDSKKADNNN